MYGIHDTYREPADEWRNNQLWPMSVWMPPGSRWAAGEPLTLTWVTEGEGVRMPVFLEVTLSVGVGIHQSYIWDIWPTSIGVWIPKVCRPPLPRPHTHEMVTKQIYIRDIYFTMTAEWSLKFLYWIIRIWQLMEVCLVTISQHFGYTLHYVFQCSEIQNLQD